MTPRDHLPIDEHRPLDRLLASDTAIPGWWASREDQIQAALANDVTIGEVERIAVSPGGRAVCSATYGEPEPDLRGRANWNSALGAQDPDAYWRRSQRRRPVLIILAGVHGAEVEGMVACLSILRIMETGQDITGQAQPTIADKLRRLRLIVMPVGNPDGRARVPYDGWVGLPTEEMHRVGQGTRRDDSLYGWPDCKATHPMRGDVGFLGGYFDDAGVNLMHDEWTAPVSPTTPAILSLVRNEGPDMFINLHSHINPPAVLSCAYIPMTAKQRLADFARDYYARLTTIGLVHGPTPAVAPDGDKGAPPPPFNLTSMAWQTGAATAITFECPHGFDDAPTAYSYQDTLTIHHTLIETAADELLDRC